MGLFDFLKKKPADAPANQPAPTPAATPGAPAADQAAEAAPSGPRYKRPNYVAPVEAAAPMAPPLMPTPPPPPSFQPANELEEALLRAGNEPEFRGIFYQLLLDQELIILPVPSPGRDSGEVTIEPGTEVQLQMLNDNNLPVFSSLERVFENNIVPEGVPYLRLRGFDFFNMVRGATCVLNPFSPVGKVLTPEELNDLLSGGLTPAPDANTRVQLSQPAEFPAALAEAVRTFSAGQPAVQTVYLAQLQLENSPEPPRLLLGFELAPDADPTFLQEMGPVVESHLTQGQSIDLMVVSPDPNDPLATYLHQTEPLYRQA